MSFRSRKALPALISRRCLSGRPRCLTLVNSVLGEKGRTGHEVDTAAYNITSGEGGAISFACHLTAESIAIIPMPTPAIRLPAW